MSHESLALGKEACEFLRPVATKVVRHCREAEEMYPLLSDQGPDRVKEIAKTKMMTYLYNCGKGAVIEKSEYIKWCNNRKAKFKAFQEESELPGKSEKSEWELKHKLESKPEEKTEEELLREFQEDPINKFEPHEACWDLNKRGGVGETPFHLCYLMDSPVHFEVGKALLEVFPKLACDVYEGEEYFGESALHIAVMLDDLDIVQLLVQNGANVNQRATGRFFLPEDLKKNPDPTAATNYDGYAYYGEYPLAFAACRGNQDIYDYLIDHGANPNFQDSFGNTVLHMVVIHCQPGMFRYAVQHNIAPAQTDILNKQNLTPLTLASKLGRSDIFRDMLDLGSVEFWRFSHVTCSAYPLAAIDSIGPNGEHNWHSALMIIVDGESDEHLEMLEGGVVWQLLKEKWKTFAKRRFLERLAIACVHLVLFSVAIYIRPSGPSLLDYTGAVDAVRYFCEVIVCLSCTATIAMEIIEISSRGFWSFLKNCSHAPAHTVNLVSCLLILACIPFRFLQLYEVEDILLIIAAPCSWFFLLFFARGVQLTGPFVTMIYKMLRGDLIRFGIIYLIFLIGFTQGFYFLFRDVTDDDDKGAKKFETFPETILTLFQMTLGEFKYDAFGLSRHVLLTKLVFVIFMILMPILLLNMLIAMMGNTYTQVISKSEKQWRKQWAKIVVVLERGFSKKQLLQFQKDYSVNARETTQKLGKEVIRQLRTHKRDKNDTFQLHKRFGTAVSDDAGIPNLSSTVDQLAWEQDIDLSKGQTFVADADQLGSISPRYAKRQDPSQTSTSVSSKVFSVPSHITGSGERHNQRHSQQAASSAASPPPGSVHRLRFPYNRVAPLSHLPPVENTFLTLNVDNLDSSQEDNKSTKSMFISLEPLTNHDTYSMGKSVGEDEKSE
ncbi:hypothetical protein C0Q70_15824 [Pomacea canaliculata]|uniref:Ion transport domain-containing protein n=1 Tax=Pomacea canaliculata TaxID=400727 RepID=A0A2T7NVZ7_POMCA|nr:hypothetical protein C0Q70_15824 [Pomacea canaliculata]